MLSDKNSIDNELALRSGRNPKNIELCKRCLSDVGIDKSIYAIARLYEMDSEIPVSDERRRKIVDIAKTAAAEIYIILGGV